MSRIEDWAYDLVQSLGAVTVFPRSRNDKQEILDKAFRALNGIKELRNSTESMVERIGDSQRDEYNEMNRAYEDTELPVLTTGRKGLDLYEMRTNWRNMVEGKNRFLEGMKNMLEAMEYEIGDYVDVRNARRVLEQYAEQFGYDIYRGLTDYRPASGSYEQSTEDAL